jgi:surfeit locus 1 family protein
VSESNQVLTVSRAGLIGSLIVLAVAGLCVRLGLWQLSRLQQRDAHNELLAERMRLPPFTLEPARIDTTRLLFRRAEVTGRYDHDRTIVLAGRALRGVPGVHVLTPVLLDSGHTAVLVNRGWQPAADGATVDFDTLRTAAEVRLTGLVLPLPARTRRPQPAAADGTFRRTWFSIDPQALRNQYPYRLLDVHIQALPDSAAPRYPIRLPPPALDRGPHLGYAIQWFSFAAIAVIGWTILMLRTGEFRRSSR